MDLKFRRNLPLLLLFISIVTILLLGLGNQPIIAYTIKADGASGSQSVTGLNSLEDIFDQFSLSAAEEGDIITPASDAAESFDNATSSDAFPNQDYRTPADSQDADVSSFQPDEG